MDESRTKYILLNDRVGETVEKNILSFGLASKISPTQVLRGELLEALPEEGQPQDSHKIAVVGLDRKKLRLVCRTEDLTRLSDEEANLLLAISSVGERYDIFINRKRLDIGRKIHHGSPVLVKVKGIAEDLVGVVWYKGEVSPFPGTMFGVELIEDVGQGTCDGTFWNKKYFECQKDSGVFVALDKIMLKKDLDTRSKKEERSHFNSAARLTEFFVPPFSKERNERKLSHDAMERILKIDQRVTANINGKAIRGRVRYIGEERDHSGQPYTVVGLESDSRDGAGTGSRHGKQRFVCRLGFAHFVPIEAVKPEGISQEWENRQEKLPAADQHCRDDVMARSLSYSVNTADIMTELHDLRDEVKRLNLHQRNWEREVSDLLHQKQHLEEELEREKNARQRAELEITNLQSRLRTQEERVQELETSLSAAQQTLDQRWLNDEYDWIICRDEINVSENCLGVGGWGTVLQGTFRGCKVAVKQIHELILSPHNRRLFEREMNIASKCRHPCLLQFIGATNNDGNPLFVTELMESSLRTLLQERELSEKETSTISMDVALALNYLHLNKFPIVHRDVSSANVLLWRQGNKWRGKVSDYGTANFMRQSMTVAPGALIYCAPEAVTSNQTVKMDVYSFGVLVCEMCIRELPDPQLREEQVASVTNHVLRGLIRRCIQSEPGTRPTMEEVVNHLEELSNL